MIWITAAVAATLATGTGWAGAAEPEARTPHAGMIRTPDVSATHIAFRYADDLWLVPREGGSAVPLASPPGPELLPRFSPDGSRLAFVAHYDGSAAMYTVPVAGGVPVRATYHPPMQGLCDWTPDGRLLYFTAHRNWQLARTELFTVDPDGGMPRRVAVPYGAEASMSADGRYLAYMPVLRRWVGLWKRYVGGSATDLWVADLEEGTYRKVTDWVGSDIYPMWHGGKLYYVSDAGPNHRRNIWVLDLDTGERRQLTRHAEFDVRRPAAGPGPGGEGEIVFTVGDSLRLLDLATGEEREVEVRIPGARETLRPRHLDVAKAAGHFSVAPGGKRLAVEARGDVWTVPAEHGAPRNLTRTSGAAERYPSWSPDGRWIAFFSDRSGEYELYVVQSDGKAEPRQVTSGHRTFFYPPAWSPDSKRLVFQEKTGDLWLCTVASGELERIATDSSAPTRPEAHLSVAFSPDSRWIALHLPEPFSESIRSLWLYDTEQAKLHRVTGAMADEAYPVFDRKGDHLYFTARRALEPVYSEVEFDWAFTDTMVLMAAPLRDGVERPFAAKSDEVTWEEEDETAQAQDAPAEDAERKAGGESGEDGPAPVTIELDGFQQRAYQLPVKPGFFSSLAVNDEGHLLYLSGRALPGLEPPQLKLVDPTDEKGEDKLVAAGAQAIAVSADGGTVAVSSGGGAPKLYRARAEAEAVSPVTDGMIAHVEPRAEWEQVFDDTWRLFRDFFYDEEMHGVDWPAVRDRYAAMLPDCASRADVTLVIGEMIGELNVGHARYRPPQEPGMPKGPEVGLLGVDFELADGGYRFARIYEGPDWRTDTRSPLARPDLDVGAGDYLLAVNGVPMDTSEDPWSAFVGLAGREVVLTVGPRPEMDEDARDIVVKARDWSWEEFLRYRAWAEDKRRYVDEVSGGRIGYMHIPNYVPSGLELFVEQFFPQQGREALIIDERFNGGGWTPHRFLEFLDRPPMMYRAKRHAVDNPVPSDAHFGPKCLLMNDLSGSSGDMFPWMFRHAGLGPLIGTRTWGGVVGLSGNPGLIDGSYPVIPNAGTYTADGRWIIEGWGVEPDIEVPDDPAALMEGTDVQLERAIEEMRRALERPHHTRPEPPAPPDRTGMGVPEAQR
jgi:tricorn protease